MNYFFYCETIRLLIVFKIEMKLLFLILLFYKFILIIIIMSNMHVIANYRILWIKVEHKKVK